MSITTKVEKVIEGEEYGHLPYQGRHRTKSLTFTEKCILHFSTHCVHFIGFVIISIIPIAIWEKGPEVAERFMHG